ncbi:MAG TPA: R3H domain-containing nucleic acid-binding protein [Thermoanaerobaculia bacterium]|nr:R3H domain-containing nucleic acid-binding protein [Thermoanaerobaculia bacterium]
MSQRFEGRNLEEALQAASQGLGVERWQLTYHVLLEKRGFLGGMKRVVIEADVNAEAPPPPPPPAPLESYPDVPAAPPRRERGPRGGGRTGGGGARREGRGGGGGRGGDRGGDRGGSRGRERGGRGGRGSGGDRELRVGDFETFLGDLPEQGPESDAARAVREWCERAVALTKLDLVIRTSENDTQILVKLYGADVSRLVDKHGELLDAIQVLANKALVGRPAGGTVEKEIELDAEEFKGQRMQDLEARAREVADRVRRGGREELLPSMTPIERRIVHIALRDDADVTTESRGDGFYKRVAIVPRSEAKSNDEQEQPAES